MRQIPLYLFLVLLLQACSAPDRQEVPNEGSRRDAVEKTATTFFATYAERSDWAKFCSFYRADMVFEDITLQLKLDSLWQFKRFYNWDGEGDNFRKLSPDQEHITVHHLLVNDSMAVAQCTVNPFYYYDQLIDIDWGMEACFWLYFDENLKIKKQVDWIEYDPSVLVSVVKRYEEQGVDKTPDWLDLSRDSNTD